MHWQESAAREVAVEMTRQAKTWLKANGSLEGFQASTATAQLIIRREWQRGQLSESDRSELLGSGPAAH